MRRPLAIVAIQTAIIVYAILLLWPYDFTGAHFGNGAEATLNGGVSFQKPGIAVAQKPLTWLMPAVQSQELDLSLRFRSSIANQTGPARLVTLSKDTFTRNLTIAQDGADLTLRLRLPKTDDNGLIDKQPILRIPNVFPTKDWVHLQISIRPDALRVTKDGEVLLRDALPARALEGWDLAHKLALGNEHSLSRPWIGEIQSARIRSGDVTTIDYALPETLRLPAVIVISAKPPKLIPFKNLNAKDALANILLFVPFGVLLGVFIRDAGGGPPRWYLAFGGVLLIVLVSASFETLQIFVPPRAPSIDDFIFNIGGGTLSLLVVVFARFRDRGISSNCGS